MEPPRYRRLSVFAMSCALFASLCFASLSLGHCDRVGKRMDGKIALFLGSFSDDLFCGFFAVSLPWAVCLVSPWDALLSALRLCLCERVWAISTARLRTLPHVHLQPIDVVVFNGPYMEILSWGGLRA